MTKRRFRFVRCFAGFVLSTLYAIAQSAQNPADTERMRRVEMGLLPAGAMKEKLGVTASIEERLEAYGVPGVSIAVIDGGRIAWAKGYGKITANGNSPVTTATLFQAGSISKPVAALGALSLVERKKLVLDEDVNARLRTWKIPANDLTAKDPVTLRMLLSHSGGVTVHGFPGYEVGKPVPSLTQILNGEPPGNTSAIRVDSRPGERFRYSGGGYTVMQQLLIDVSGQPFDAFMTTAVLRPLDMQDSTYSQALPAPLAQRVATGHYAGGQEVAGGHHIYPEMAAAGLWTTATDLAKFAIYVQQASAGAAEGVISEASAKEMLSRQRADAGLGLFLSGEGAAARFGHDGVDEGFEANLIAYVGSSRGAVIMANANFTRPLMKEILASIAREYQWPSYPQTKQQEIVPLPRPIISAAVGRYVREDDVLEVFAKGDRLFGRVPGVGEVEIHATEQDRFFVPQFGGSFIRFERQGNAPASSVRMGLNGSVELKRAQ